MFSASKSNKLMRFIKSVLLLAVTGITMRTVAVYFNIFLTGKLGSEGIGLYTLICSVYNFAITFATSAVNLASTRLVSEALGKESDNGVRQAMKKCVTYSLFFGISAFILLFMSAPLIAERMLGDTRTLLSLRFFALSLPFIALSSCLNGYFTAVRRVAKNAAVQLCEQGVRIGVCVFLLSFFMPESLEIACLFVVIAGCLADFLSFAYSFAMYRADLKRHVSRTGENDGDCQKKLFSIALPVALSSYIRSGLVTVEHMLIPWGLRKRGASNEAALKSYGVVQAMALPVVMFPYALLTPFCSLLIPEISERRARSDKNGVEKVTSLAVGFVLIFGIGVSGIMGLYSSELASLFCKAPEASSYIRMLAPLLPIMYLDTVTDSILKGMDHQAYTMRINIMDAFLSVIAVFLLVPRIGVYGYLAEIVICELINASLSVWKLLKVVRFRPRIITRGLFPLISIIIATRLSNYIFGYLPLTLDGSILALGVMICFTLAVYLMILKLLYGFFTGEKLLSFTSLGKAQG